MLTDAEDELLQRVKQAFVPRLPLKPRQQSRGQREPCNASKSANSTPGVQLDTSVTSEKVSDNHQEYAEAVREHEAAEREFNEVVEQWRSLQIAQRNTSPDPDLLFSQIRLRQAELVRDRLTTLQKYRREVEQTKSSNDGKCDRSDEHGTDFEASLPEEDPGVDTSGVSSLLKKLKVAVIEAECDCRLERNRLEAARKDHQESNYNTAAKINAMQAVRTELTTWLEESLTACANDELAPNLAPSETQLRSALSAEDVQQAYDNYITARQNVIQAANLISKPVNPPERSISELEVRLPAEPVLDELLKSRQNNFLPEVPDLSSDMQQFARTQLDTDEAVTLEHLARLVDESQLLSEFPIIARASQGNYSTSVNVTQGETPGKLAPHIEAWEFAAKASTDSTNHAKSVSFRTGAKAMEGTKQNIEDLKTLSEG